MQSIQSIFPIQHIGLLLTCLTITFITYAQPPGVERPPMPHQPPSPEQIEKMKAHKVTFITNELDLTAEEAAKFWPVYNEMDAKLTALRQSKKSMMEGKKPGELSDEELEKLVDQHVVYKQQELDIEKEYLDRFKVILPMQKVAKLQRVDQKFHRQLIRKLSDKEQMHHPKHMENEAN